MLWLLLLTAAAAAAFAASSPREEKFTGKSGTTWTTRVVARNGENVLVEVISPARVGALDVGAETMVIRYVQQGNDPTRRFLAATAPTILVTMAMDDFGVKGPGGVQPPKPNDPPPPNPSPAVPVGKIRVDPGTYEANISIGFPASVIATVGLLRNGIAGKGFTQVFVTDERPARWSVAGEADYYVRATWPRAAELFDRPKALDSFKRVG